MMCTLTSTGKVTIQDLFVQVVLPLPDTTSATLTPEVIVKNHDAAPVKGILTGKIGDITSRATGGIYCQRGEELLLTRIPLAN